MPEGKRIQVKPLSADRPQVKRDATREYLATLCYYFPQYTLKAARQLPYRDVALLLRIARRLEAVKYSNLTQIAAAPNTKKGVNELLKQYREIMDSN